MDKIVDLHTHILPGIDDGARDIQESINIINYLVENGITDIVLSSHYIKNTSFNYNQIARSKILNKLINKLNNPKIKLYIGNEIFLTEDVIELLENHEISTINNSKYMLIELPMTGYMMNLQNVLCELTDYGVIPIIAHPERYSFLQKDKKRVRELLEFNCLLQCNVDSLTGNYGHKAKKLMKWLLKNNLVSFVATDTHYVGSQDKLKKAYKKLKRKVGQDKYKELTYINPKKVLNNETVLGNLEYLIKEENR